MFVYYGCQISHDKIWETLSVDPSHSKSQSIQRVILGGTGSAQPTAKILIKDKSNASQSNLSHQVRKKFQKHDYRT